MTPDQTIAQLITLRHGGAERMMPPEIKALFSEVEENPRVYASAIAKFLQLPSDDTPLLSRLDVKRLSSALSLARRIGPEHGGPMVRQFYDAVGKRLYDCQEREDKEASLNANSRIGDCHDLRLLKHAALEGLAEFEDTYAVDACVSTVEKERKYMRGTWLVMLRYLEKVAPLRPDIEPKLKQMYDDPGSSLHNNPQLLRVLKVIDRADADKADAKKERTTPRTP